MNKEQEQNIKQHYKWFCDSCDRRRIKSISYKQFRKEHLEMLENMKKPEEKQRLKDLKKCLDNAMELLK